jgi:outer membrane protein OmpA-like peptidoglycan-associated protein
MPRLLGSTLALLTLVAACAPVRPSPGALAPVPARTTNEILAADLATIDAWERRRVALLSNDGADLAARTVVLARAGAWLAFAREVYVERPRAPDADDALAEARRLIESASGTMTAASAAAPAATPTALLATAERLSPELWKRLRELEASPDASTRVTTLADAEIELVRAVVSNSSLLCAPSRHLARAGRLFMGEEAVVTLAGGLRLDAPDELRKKARTVHFALASDMLHEPSAGLLDGVADAMREHPELSLVIEGHADPRGEDMGNVMLSGRRAERVRQLLVAGGVDENRVMVRMFGARQRNGRGTTVLDYARDRRVQLRFVRADGTELPAIEDESDLQIEPEHFWFGALRPGLRRSVAGPDSMVVAPPVPVAPAKVKGKARTTTTHPTSSTQTTPRGKS